MIKNARFWAYINGGPVKLMLRPGQHLEHAEGGLHEEGFSVARTWWELATDEPVVYRSYSVEGCDCDGRHGSYGSDSAKLDQLSFHQSYDMPAGVRWPNWTDRETSQYDQYAEMAGY